MTSNEFFRRFRAGTLGDSGMTVQDVLDALKFSFRMIAVKVNGQPVLRRDFASTEVPDGAEVLALHMISGG